MLEKWYGTLVHQSKERETSYFVDSLEHTQRNGTSTAMLWLATKAVLRYLLWQMTEDPPENAFALRPSVSTKKAMFVARNGW